MKERPILFTGEMVKAILEGSKTQTRRVIKPQPTLTNRCAGQYFDWRGVLARHNAPRRMGGITKMTQLCPYGQVCDRLWVRETWKTEELEDGLDGVRFKADMGFQGIENTVSASDAWVEAHWPQRGWHPSIFMPRWASRIALEITGIRVQRVQEISEKDALAEGIAEGFMALDTISKYAFLWSSINAKRGYGWDVNPWVWVIEFQVVQ